MARVGLLQAGYRVLSGGGGGGGGGGGATPPPGSYPGQAGNLVGYNRTPAAAPAEFANANGKIWPGAYSSLTAWPGGSGNISISSGVYATSGSGTSTDPYVFAFYDFNSGLGGVDVILSNCIFVGCRFQSNARGYYNVRTDGTNQTYIYCSFVPLVSLYTSPPGSTIWPSAGAQANTTTQTNGVNGIDGNSGFQTGLSVAQNSGNITAAYCDCWGSGNSFCQMSTPTVGSLTFSNCYVHDCANQTAQVYHQDGIGYVDGLAAPSNITINHCTIASLGNTNGIAFQSATSGYANISITNNYFTGFGFFGDFGHDIAANSNWTVTDNVFGSDIQWIYGPVGSGPANFTNHNANLWRRNTFKFITGTTKAATSNWLFSATNDGNFIWPDASLNTTDWTS